MNRSGFPLLPFFAALAALATYAATCLLVRMSEYGPAIGWDAVHYISVARSLLNGDGFLPANGSIFWEWPPLYPMLLAATSALASVDPRDVAGPLNAVFAGLCVLAAGAWMRRALNSRFLVVWGCLAVALSPALTITATRALSETVFILFATLAFTRMDRHLADSGRSSLVWAAVFTGLAWATRYMGVVVAIAAVAVLAGRRGVSPLDKAKEVALYSLVSAAPVGAWLVRNLVVTGRFVSSGLTVDYTWLEAVGGIAGAFGGLLAETGVQALRLRESWPALHVALGGLSMLALGASLVVGAMRARVAKHDSGSSFHLFGGFVILYVCFYTWSTIAGNTWHGVQPRHLMPVYIPFLFALLLAADRFLDRERKQPPTMAATTARWTGARTAGGLTLVAMLSIWVAWTAPAHLIGTLEGEGAHEGYVFDYRNSEVMRWLRNNPTEASLSSNDVYAVYINISGVDSASTAYRSLIGNRPIGVISGDTDSRDTLQLSLDHTVNGDRVVWLFGESHNHLFDYDAADMRARAGLRVVADLADGAVFEVDKTFGGGAGEWRSAASIVGPDVRAVFDVRVHENRLIYVKGSCVRSDTRARFFLHIFPADESDLAGDRKRYGFMNLDFDFQRRGARFEKTCVAMVALPEWRIARVATGQFAGDGKLWEAEIPFGEAETGPAPAPLSAFEGRR